MGGRGQKRRTERGAGPGYPPTATPAGCIGPVAHPHTLASRRAPQPAARPLCGAHTPTLFSLPMSTPRERGAGQRERHCSMCATQRPRRRRRRASTSHSVTACDRTTIPTGPSGLPGTATTATAETVPGAAAAVPATAMTTNEPRRSATGPADPLSKPGRQPCWRLHQRR